jgi:hypothetical protein
MEVNIGSTMEYGRDQKDKKLPNVGSAVSLSRLRINGVSSLYLLSRGCLEDQHSILKVKDAQSH